MAQFEDMKNLDLYDDDTIAAAQKGFEKDTNRNNDYHCSDDGLDENERTLPMIIEKEDDDFNSTSDAEQNVYNLPVREVNDETDSLNEMKDLEINTDTEDLSKEIPIFTELYNDHDGEQFVENSASIVDVQIENKIDTCGDEKAAFNSRSKYLFGKSRKRSKLSHDYDNPRRKMAGKKRKRPKPLDKHENSHSKMAERKKKGPKVYKDHERSQLRMVEKLKKSPKLYEKCNNSQSKLIERRRRRSRTGKNLLLTMLRIKNSIALCGFLIICNATSIHGMEPEKLKHVWKHPQSCSGESAPVYGSSGPFYDVYKCEQELNKLICNDQSILKACIRYHDRKSLWAVCTKNTCFHDQSCPEVTIDPHKALVVQSIYCQCQSCNNTENLQGRLKAYGNVGTECLNISGTSQQPTSTDEDDGLFLKVAIPISVLVAILFAIGIGFGCVKYRRGRNNMQNRNNANSVDLEQNGGQGVELLMQNGGGGSEILTQNGRFGVVEV